MQSNPRPPSGTYGALNRLGHPLPSSASSASSTSSSNTPPLKIAKQTTAYASSSSLVGGVKGGVPVARRSSSSFNHVRTSTLVSSSPFKTGGNTTSSTPGARPRPQHAPAASQHGTPQAAARRPISVVVSQQDQSYLRARSNENKPSDDLRKPRESKGFQNLPNSKAVTKSPFVEANGVTSATRSTFSKLSDTFGGGSTGSSVDRMVKSATYPSIDMSAIPVREGLSNSSSSPVISTPVGSRPLPGTPQKQRPFSMDITVPTSSSPIAVSPRSILASKQRLIGPRSPEGTPSQRGAAESPGTKQHHKTVTWDEECDVVEFEQESVTGSEVSQDTERSEQNSEHSDDEVAEPVFSKAPESSNEFFGPDRENGRSPSPILSGSINDLPDDGELETLSANSLGSGDEGSTPQRRTVDLPLEEYKHDDPSGMVSLASIPGIAEISSFADTRRAFQDDSMSTQDDSFTNRASVLRHEETSLRFSETRSPERFPRISRDTIRRQVEQQRESGSFDGNMSIGSPSRRPTSDYNDPDRSNNISAFRRSHYSPTASPGFKSQPEQLFTTNPDAKGSNLNLEDVHSALDRLMLGVEKGFEPSINSNVSDMEEDDQSYREVVDEDRSDHYERSPVGGSEILEPDEDMAEQNDVPLLRESTAISAASTDGPITPQLHQSTLVNPSLSRDPRASISESKPLPPPPETSSPLPTVHVTLEDEEPAMMSEAGGSLSVPMVTVRRGSTIKKREEAIKAKRREQRALEGRPSRRRSQSTGDLRAQFDELDQLELAAEHDADLTDVFQTEVAKLQPTKKTYMMKQRRPTIYASDSRVGHLGATGDVHGGRAWRAVRRPSDMNEYSKQIRQIRNQERAGNAQGKVFVKGKQIIGIRELDVPLPTQPTYFTCVLNNGIHFVETPASRLEPESVIDQEFELIEHQELEFTLTIKIRKDAHIAQILNPPPRPAYVPPRVETPTKSKGGMRSFFSSPAKKASRPVMREREPVPEPIQTADPFGRYLKKDLSIAKALVSFKDIVEHCDTKLFETSYPLVGQCSDGKQLVTKAVGEIVLQLFRLPPLPGVGQDDLPQSLEDCLRGLRHVQWHKVIYHEGLLTQLGGDCTTWRRRNLRVLGASLIAYNDVTKKPITTMDLRKVTLIEDDGRAGVAPTIITPPTGTEGQLQPQPRLRRQRSFNALDGIEHSFRVVFDGNENDEVCFFADSAEEKSKWMEIFGALIGRIPHNPLWAELLWQRQQEMA